MASTFSILGIGWSAMMTHRLAGEVASHNIANAATPGYSRQRADLQARQPWLTFIGPMGTGVQASGIQALRDTLLEGRMFQASSDYGFASGRLSVLEPAQTTMGIGGEDPVSSAMASFFSALGDLAVDPAGAVPRQQVLASAQGLGATFKQVRDELSGIRNDLDLQVSGLVGEIQARLDEIAVLNREIRATEASGGQANDLRDRRALLAREVSERIGVNAFTDQEGNLNLALTGGGVLVEGDQAARLQTAPDPANDGLLTPVLVSLSGAQTTLDPSCSGQLGGVLAARDQEIKQAITDLDNLAFELVNQFNQVHRAGFGADGTGGRDLFNPLAGVDGAAARIELDTSMVGQPDRLAAALDPAALPGDNQNALALADLADLRFMAGGTQTAGEYWQASVSGFGSGLRQAGRDLELHASRISQLSAMREAVSGVSIDEEMIELVKAQRAFEAAAKVIQTGDELLETILSLK